jgi:hypothetical protein
VEVFKEFFVSKTTRVHTLFTGTTRKVELRYSGDPRDSPMNHVTIRLEDTGQ